MKKKWYVNWLVIITVCLFVSSLGLFFASIQESLGIVKCAYGDVVIEGDRNCLCDSRGRVVCDEQMEEFTIKSEEFVTNNLSFTYKYLNLSDGRNSVTQDVEFMNISQVGNTLRVVVEKNTFCNIDNEVAPQVGFYKLEDNRIILTIGTNLVDTSYSIPCISEDTFLIGDMPVKFDNDAKLLYQDQYGSLIPSRNCSYEGFLRNDGDVYNSSDGSLLCVCKLGESVCEKE
ncbi:MAG: hypothetical protein RBT33_01565 [Candidatus Dojkabacteria bacterium]|jgi:hypothetical protein|nr:hypothetical protein [Candidatus Dojkabacteria bacterium]